MKNFSENGIYKIYIMSGEDVLFKFTLHSTRNPFKVIVSARDELKRHPYSSHAIIKGLKGKCLSIQETTSKFESYLSSFFLNRQP